MKVIELYTPTCMPCKILDKKIQDLLKNHPEVEYEHLNAIKHPEYNIKGTPHLIVEKDGKEIFNSHVTNIVEAVGFIEDNL